MDLQYLANLSELVGGVVVVLSLIYIAVQVRQNTQAQRTENYSRAQDRLAAIQSMLAQDGEISLIVSKGALDTSKLTPQERIRFTWCSIWIRFQFFPACRRVEKCSSYLLLSSLFSA